MPWRDGIMSCLPVRLPDHVRAAVEDHRAWLEERHPGPISLAEATRDLLERGLRHVRRFRAAPVAQLALAFEEHHQARERERHG